MSWKDYFIVGIKLIGLYCLLRGIEGIFQDFPLQLRTFEGMGQIHGVFKVSALLSMTIPLIMGGLGLYLIRDGRRLHGIPSFDVGMEGGNGWIAFGLVLFGFYLLASVVPDALRIVPDLAIVLQAPSYVSTDESMHRLKVTGSLTSITALLGTACILRGKTIAALVFKQTQSEQQGVQ